MTNIAKEVFEKYQVRKSRKQRTAFIEYVKDFSHNHGYEVKVEKGSFKSRNIVVGDVDNAKVIYSAHYDTCARMFFPNFMTPKNIFIYIIYQLLIVAGFFVASAVLTFPFAYLLSLTDLSEGMLYNFCYDIWLIIYFFLLFLLMFGPRELSHYLRLWLHCHKTKKMMWLSYSLTLKKQVSSAHHHSLQNTKT